MKTRIRILHVTEARRVAGTERSLLMLLDHGSRAQFEHGVVSRGSGSLADELARRNVATITIPRRNRADPVALVRFAAALKKLNPDVVHVYGGRLEAVIAHSMGKPVVERKNVCRNSFYRPMIGSRWADRLLNHFVDVSVCPSAAVRSHYLGRGYSPASMKVVYNGVDPAPARTPEATARKRRETGLPPDAFLVAFAGRLMPEKGVDVLLSALARLPEKICCVIMGDGPHRNTYEQQAGRLGLESRVVFTGFISDVREVFACSDAVAVPSYSEPLANVALEAMAEGRPVVATNVEGMPEAVEHGVTGLLVAPGDAAALAEALATLAESADAAMRMGREGKQRALYKLLPQRMARQTENIYIELLRARTQERELTCHRTPTAAVFEKRCS